MTDEEFQVNIQIMRTFVQLRQMFAVHKDLERKLTALEKKYDERFKVVFDAIRALMTPPEKPRRKTGFEVKEGRAAYGRKKEELRNWKIKNECVAPDKITSQPDINQRST